MLGNDLHTAKIYASVISLQWIVIDLQNRMIETLYEYKKSKQDGFAILSSDKAEIGGTLLWNANTCGYTAGQILNTANTVHVKDELINSVRQQHERVVSIAARIEVKDGWDILDSQDFYNELEQSSDLAYKLRRFMRDQEKAHIQSTSWGAVSTVQSAIQKVDTQLQSVPMIIVLSKTDEENFDLYFQMIIDPAHYSDTLDVLEKVSTDIRAISDSLFRLDGYEHYSPASDMCRTAWHTIREMSDRILTVKVNIEANIEIVSDEEYDSEDENDSLRENADIIANACAQIMEKLTWLKEHVDNQRSQYWDMIKD